MKSALGIFCVIFVGSDAFSSVSKVSLNFWETAQVQNLPDPPSAELLELIREKPYRGGFEPAIERKKYEPRIVQGQIPKDLVGTLAGNGPGRIRIGERQYGHWFDGDGYVTELSLDGTSNKATFQGRYVRTSRFLKQEALMKQLDHSEKMNPPLAFCGAWTKKGKGEWFKNILAVPENPANTATMWLPPRQGETIPRLFALCEGGQPIEIDPMSLETIGDEDSFFHGSTPSFFSAHHSRDLENGVIYNHGYVLKPGPGEKEINLMKLDTEGNLLQQATTTLPIDTFVHDSCTSQNHIVYFLPPYAVPLASLPQFLTGNKAFAKLYMWDIDGKTVVHVHSKDDLSLKWKITLPELESLYHFSDAYEEEDGKGNLILRVRLVELDNADRIALEEQFSDQYRVDTQRRVAVLREYTFQLNADGSSQVLGVQNVAKDAARCEFPVVNPFFATTSARRRYCWTNAESEPYKEWLDGIQKIDMLSGTASPVITCGEGTYLGGPTFVPRKGASAEDEGYLIATVYKSKEHRNNVVIFDATTLETICVMELTNHIPYSFHTEFQPDFVV